MTTVALKGRGDDSDDDREPSESAATRLLTRMSTYKAVADGAEDGVYVKKFLTVEGMTCGACSSGIEKLLRGIDGVKRANVSLLLHRAEVYFDQSKTNLDDMIEDIEDIGFDASELKLSASGSNEFVIELKHKKEDSVEKVKNIILSISGVLKCEDAEQPVESKRKGKKNKKKNKKDRSHLSKAVSTAATQDMRSRVAMRNSIYFDGGFNEALDLEALRDEAAKEEAEKAAKEEKKKQSKYAGGDSLAQPMLIDMDDMNTNLNNITTLFEIKFDSKITGMRSITEYINIKTPYDCAIKYDSSDIMSRKKTIQNSRDSELKKWKRMLIFSSIFAVPTMILALIFVNVESILKIFEEQIITGFTYYELILGVLSTCIQFGPPGLMFYRGAFKSMRNMSANMDVLVALASTIAYGFSVITVLINVVLQEIPSDTTFETSAILITFILIGKYMEAKAKAKTSSALDALMNLQPTRARLVDNFPMEDPHHVNGNEPDKKEEKEEKKEEHHEEESLIVREIDTRLLQLHDVVEVIRGAKMPCDGVIVRGESRLDEALITGESRPVKKTIGDKVIGATINKQNTLYVKVTSVGNDTVLSKIISLVENAQSTKAPIQNFADNIASKFVFIVIGISLTVTIGWYVSLVAGWAQTFGKGANDSHLYQSIAIGVAVLVISCPCALGLATPTAVMVATGKAAELGILFKGGEPIELCGKTRELVFDKTGTLTQGKMSVVNILSNINEKLMKCDRTTFWNMILSAEGQSEHLIAVAVCKFIDKFHAENNAEEDAKIGDNLQYLDDLRFNQLGDGYSPKKITPKKFTPKSGLGIMAQYLISNKSDNSIKDEHILIIGNEKFMKQNNVNFSYFANHLGNNNSNDDGQKYVMNKVNELSMTGNTVIYVACNGILVALICIADKVKENADFVIAYLQNFMNVNCYIISGDNEIAVNAVGKSLGIPPERIFAQTDPGGKQDHVKRLQAQFNKKNTLNADGEEDKGSKHIVTFVGDGINDSPSLAQADVGIAIGAGTDIAIASASVILMNSRIEDVLNAIDLSTKTRYRIKSNFGWAIGYNCLMIPFAAGILYPALHWTLPAIYAALLMCVSSITVVTNSLVLKLYKPLSKKEKYTNTKH